MSIVTVTPNPALDITYTLDNLRPGEVHRVRTTVSRPGGKGLNVARVLHALGVPVVATGLVGGSDGIAIRTQLSHQDVPEALVVSDLVTRRTVTVIDESAGSVTLLNEAGPVVDAAQWRRLHDRVGALLATADALVISGSLPPGITADALAELVRMASAESVPVIADVPGDAIDAVISAGADVIKPNADELRDATGMSDPRRSAEALRERARCVVVASLGEAGILAVTGDGTYAAKLDEPLSGNATGAGDSVVAALAAGLRAGRQWADILRDACALSAATVLAPVAGEYDADAYARLARTVDVRKVGT